MFTSTMNDAEIQQEARKDFFELSTKVSLAFDNFIRRHRNMIDQSELMFNDTPASLITSTLENKKWRTRRNNTWVSHFRFRNLEIGLRMAAAGYLYTALYRTHGTEYIFLNNLTSPLAERFTTHFIDRYKERHLRPNNIDTGSIPVPLYFQIHNPDNIMGRYYKTTDLDIQEGVHKKFWIAPEGIYVTDYIDGMFTYITFMDKDDLSPLKQQVYEEEIVWDLMLRSTDDRYSEEERRKAAFSIANNPDLERIFRRFAKRNIADNDDGKSEFIHSIRGKMAALRVAIDNAKAMGEQRQKDLLRKNRVSATLNANRLINDIEIKEYDLNKIKNEQK